MHMGLQLSFSEDNVKKNPFDYPKLKLAKGETARLTVVENPYSEYVHQIQKPILNEQGKIVYRTADKQDGTQYQTPKLAFVSNPICLGDREVLAEKGIDPDNCPMCARAAEGQKGYYPKRRFAMHVIRTNTVPGKFEPNGTGHQILIWAFTDRIFSKIVEINNEFGLADHDLKLGPCEDEQFQKAELAAASNTTVDDSIKSTLFVDKNKAEDPTIFCGSRKSRERVLEDLAQVDAVWAKANGEEDDASLRSSESLSKGLDALLSDEKPAAGGDLDLTSNTSVAPASDPTPATSFDDIPSSPASEKPAETKSTANSVDDILAGL